MPKVGANPIQEASNSGHRVISGEDTLRKPAFIVFFLGALLLMASAAQAQTQLDLAFGVSGVKGTSANNVSGASFFPQDVGGGAFPTFSGDFLLFKHFGIDGEVSWRATRNLSQGFLPFRPIFYDFGVIYTPPLGKRAALELTTGIGGESIRFYQGFLTCNFFQCTDFTSSNHLLWEVGGGLRLYAWHNVFIRPEARFYLVRNNFEFSSNHATRLGVSVGYSFGR
jgi:hypothetical protein